MLPALVRLRALRDLRLHPQRGERGAQFVRRVRGKAALVLEGVGDAPDQRVEGVAQRRDFVRQRRAFVEWRQRLRVERADLARHRVHRTEHVADHPPHGERHQRQRQRGRQQQRQAGLARQPLARGVRLSHHHAVFGVLVLCRIEAPAAALVGAVAEAGRCVGREAAVAGGAHQALPRPLARTPDLERDRHRVSMAVLVQFLDEVLDLAAGDDRQQRFRNLGQLAVEHLVGLAMGALVDHERGHQPDRRHHAGQQPDQPAAQRIGAGRPHAPADGAAAV